MAVADGPKLGVFGYASTHESLFGTLEYTPVIIALLLWAVFPLEKILTRCEDGKVHVVSAVKRDLLGVI